MRGIVAQIIFTFVLFLLISKSSGLNYNIAIYTLFVLILGYLLFRSITTSMNLKKDNNNNPNELKSSYLKIIYIGVGFLFFLYMLIRTIYSLVL